MTDETALALQRLEEQNERHVEAIENLVEQQKIQNAILLEQTHALHRRIYPEIGKHPEEYRRRSTASSVSGNHMDLTELVDIQDAERAADR